ncbi:ParE family toxin-like protein [Enterovibrio calviensis]
MLSCLLCGAVNVRVRKGTPIYVIECAETTLHSHLNGIIRARLTKQHKHKCLNVGRNYRLLNKRGKWYLLPHEIYNNEIKKR